MSTADDDPHEMVLRPDRAANGGEAVGRVGGRVVFVRDAIPGELVRARVVDDTQKRFVRAEAVEILEPSPHRVDPVCDAARHGAGCCDLSFVSVEHARTLKAEVVADALARIGGLATDTLDDLGVAYTPNPRMVRGLDYYTKTTFEFVHDGLGAQSGIGGGGRYDGLMQQIGGKQDLSGIGFGIGVDRTMLAMEAEGVAHADVARCQVFGVPLGLDAKAELVGVAGQLRAKRGRGGAGITPVGCKLLRSRMPAECLQDARK